MPDTTARTRSEIDGQQFEIDGVRFVSNIVGRSTNEAFSICKNPEHVERYRRLFSEFEHPTIVELGVAQGGSVAMLALIAKPRRLVAVDISDRPLPALTDFLTSRGLTDTVSVRGGVDQSDEQALRGVLQHDLDGAAVDVVVDDASHVYEATKASFEVVFPHVRPGGVYLIEDWQVDHTMADAIARILADPSAPQHEAVVAHRAAVVAGEVTAPLPLSRLAIELVLAMCSPIPVVEEVTFTENWILVRRGTEPLGPERLRMEDLYTDPLNLVPH